MTYKRVRNNPLVYCYYLIVDQDTDVKLNPVDGPLRQAFSTFNSMFKSSPPQAYLYIIWIQLLAEQLGVRVTDVLDAEEALHATRQADGHLKVCHLLHTAQQQHTLLHILGNANKKK